MKKLYLLLLAFLIGWFTLKAQESNTENLKVASLYENCGMSFFKEVDAIQVNLN